MAASRQTFLVAPNQGLARAWSGRKHSHRETETVAVHTAA
jgi:hypothetical protein